MPGFGFGRNLSEVEDNLIDAGLELRLFWPGSDRLQACIAHAEFMAKYHAVDGVIGGFACMPVFFQPTNQHGFAVWITDLQPY